MGAFHVAQSGARRLLAHGKPGRIVFIGSWAAHTPHSHVPAYCVAKAGLRMLCLCMALEYAPHGIFVNEVAPGWVDAGVSRENWAEDPALRKRGEAKVPIGEIMTSEEVAFHVAHMCDPRNRNMVGSTLLCDGGLSLVTATSKARCRKRLPWRSLTSPTEHHYDHGNATEGVPYRGNRDEQ